MSCIVDKQSPYLAQSLSEELESLESQSVELESLSLSVELIFFEHTSLDRCTIMPAEVLKAFPHVGQLASSFFCLLLTFARFWTTLTLLCFLVRWSCMLISLTNDSPHSGHEKMLSVLPSCCMCLWTFRASFLLKDFPHSHLKLASFGFSVQRFF